MINWNTQDAHLIISCASASQFPETTQKEIVMVGKSNVGKSSLINAFTNRKRLAYVGQRPGKTRLINFYHINDELLLTDVPGYGFANRSKEEQIQYGVLMDSYFQQRHPRMMLILIDVRRGVGKDDIMMLDFARYNGIEHAIVLTKTDKLSRNKIANERRAVKKEYPDVKVLEFSSLNHDTREPIIEYMRSVL
ncbi:ribosome biogenesis GTP-binding protein YihA/YsxC [Erysipelothrix sp. D19-032]